MGRLGDEILSRLNTIVRERKAMGGPSQRRLASLVGCSSAHMTHLLTGRSPLTLDWLEKICQAMRIDPARLFGPGDAAPTCSAYDVYAKPDAALHERFQELLERGLFDETAAWIELAESLLKLCRAHFAQLLLNTGAEDGVLWRRRDDGLQAICSSLGPIPLRQLQAGARRGDWQEYSAREFKLWLKNPRNASAAHCELFLEMLSGLVPGHLIHSAGRHAGRL